MVLLWLARLRRLVEMLEVEVKYRAVPQIREKLASLNFSPAGRQFEEDVYFQHPCRDFASTDEALRVRFVDSRVEITYKGPRFGLGAKTRFEASSPAGGAIVQILEKLGFVEVARVRKRREFYKRGEVFVSVDWVEGLGEFVEIEVKTEGEVENAVRLVREVAEELGLVEEVRETYLELVCCSKS